MIGSQIIVEPKRGLWENQFQKSVTLRYIGRQRLNLTKTQVMRTPKIRKVNCKERMYHIHGHDWSYISLNNF